MPKATIANITDLGFQPEQFKSPADWLDAAGYLDRILDRIGLVVEDVVGATTYAGIAEGVLFERLAQAEEAFVEAELWRRMEKFERGIVAMNGGAKDGETIGSRLLANADDAEDRGWEYLGKVTGEDYSGGFSVGNVASGKFAESTE